MSAVIAAAGLVCPAGLGLAESAAGARARLSALREIDWCDRRLERFIVGRVPDPGLPALASALVDAPLQAREARMLRLAHAALVDVYAGLPADLPAPPLLLGLPEHHTTLPIDSERFLKLLANQAGACFDPALSIAAPRGRASGLMALSQAVTRIAAGEAGLILVGGLDSLVDLYVLAALDRAGRIRGETVSDGFSPAEGAAFLLVASEAEALRHRLPVLARIAATGSGFEPGHLYADEPYLGDGLAGVVSACLDNAGLAAPLQTVYCSFNGERYWAREFGVARIRNAAAFADEARMEHPAECFGDLGAAHGVALAALACHGLAGGYRPGPALVYASSDKGDRAAVIFERSS